jgi:phenylalanyl-tRNA synthetase alpha chain
MSKLAGVKEDFNKELQTTDSLEKVENLRIAFLGKKGLLAEQAQQIQTIPPQERKDFGIALNAAKTFITEQLSIKKTALEAAKLNETLKTEIIDVTLPAREKQIGTIHPISSVLDEIITIFSNMGFTLAEGPEIEDDFHNFTALNIPKTHPARQMHDTFYLDQEKVLRTHTSSVQIRMMENNKPPIKIISAGKTYRSDSDATHTPMFHQIEVLYVDENVNMGNLSYCINKFVSEFFGEKVKTRFRTSFFPFTEPSMEVDINYSKKNGAIEIGEGDEYMEIMGCGMVHPNVLTNVGIDPTKYQGFALGLGVERAAMLKYGMNDLRNFFENDQRWTNHYGFNLAS